MCTSDENRYITLFTKFNFNELSDSDMEEMSEIMKKLGIEYCKKCEGAGGFHIPSMDSGWEWGNCNACEGIGVINLTPYLKKELK